MFKKIKKFFADNGTWREWFSDLAHVFILMGLLIIALVMGFLF